MDCLTKMNHKHIIKLVEVIDSPQADNVYLICEYITGGSLADAIEDSDKGLPEREVWKYFRALLSALFYCHEVKQIAHRDIKPENLMLDSNGNVMLCDFGVSEFF